MSGMISLIGWSFLPSLVTSWVQSFYYSVTIRAGDPRPQPGSARFAEHRRRIHIFVVTVYLAYTIYEANYELRRQGTFYQDLGVPATASSREIKSRFRRLAALYHPDKLGGGGGGDDGSGGSSPGSAGGSGGDFFVHLKMAEETLSDPARRFAYDRFGPVSVDWAAPPLRCTTIFDFVALGLRFTAMHYAGVVAVMYVLGVLGYLSWARYERWLVVAAVLVFEVHTVTRPAYPALLTHVLNPLLARLSSLSALSVAAVPAAAGRVGARAMAAAAAAAHRPYLPFQAVSLARKVSLTSFIAFSQLGPLLGADTRSGQIVMADAAAAGGGSTADDPALAAALLQLEATSRSVDADALRLLDMEMAPFTGQTDVLRALRGRIREWLVQNTIRNDPMVRDAMGRSLQRRRADAPAGARGTK